MGKSKYKFSADQNKRKQSIKIFFKTTFFPPLVSTSPCAYFNVFASGHPIPIDSPCLKYVLLGNVVMFEQFVHLNLTVDVNLEDGFLRGAWRARETGGSSGVGPGGLLRLTRT